MDSGPKTKNEEEWEGRVGAPQMHGNTNPSSSAIFRSLYELLRCTGKIADTVAISITRVPPVQSHVECRHVCLDRGCPNAPCTRRMNVTSIQCIIYLNKSLPASLATQSHPASW